MASDRMLDPAFVARADESERAVLGSCLFSAEGLDAVFEILTPEDFYQGSHRIVARALLHLRETGGYTPDCAALHDLLYARNEMDSIGGPTYLGRLVDAGYCDAPDFVRAHAFHVAEASAKRQLAHLAADMRDGVAGRETEETIGMVQQRLEQIQNRVVPQGAVGALTLVREAVARVESRKLAGKTITGTPAGLPALDTMTNGFQPGDLILLAARPSVGKTALALQVAINAMRVGHRVLVFSLEMPAGQLTERMLANVAGVHLSRIRSGLLYEHQWEPFARGTAELQALPLHVDDRGALTVAEMRGVARRQRATGPLGLVIVDYLQLARGTSDENRNQEVSSISRALKVMAKELAVPVLALSQFSRSAEKHDGKRPRLSDLRDSGALEQDADLVLFLHREDITDRLDRKAELIVAKHRNGETGLIELNFDGARQRFNEVPGQVPAEEAALPPAEVWS